MSRGFHRMDDGWHIVATNPASMRSTCVHILMWREESGRVQLFYRSEDKYMAVPVKTEPTFSFETPKILFQGTYIIPGNPFLRNWDIHPDGKRFLMVKPFTVADSESTSAGSRRINVVLNWFEELKERVPAD